MNQIIKIVLGSVVSVLMLPSVAQSLPCQDIFFENNQLYAKALIKGSEYPVYFTTSNTPAGISRGLVEQLVLREQVDKRTRMVGDFGEVQVRRYVSEVNVELFGSEIELKNVTVSDSLGKSLHVSLRLFEDYLMQLDFPNSRLCFFDKDAINLRKVENIPLDDEPEFGRPVVEVKLNDVKTWLTFSPEYRGGILVDKVVADELGLYDSLPADDGQYRASLKGQLKTLTLGPYELDNMSIEFPKQDAVATITTRERSDVKSRLSKSTPSRGRIGVDILRHFVVTFDLKNERMHIYAPE